MCICFEILHLSLTVSVHRMCDHSDTPWRTLRTYMKGIQETPRLRTTIARTGERPLAQRAPLNVNLLKADSSPLAVRGDNRHNQIDN